MKFSLVLVVLVVFVVLAACDSGTPQQTVVKTVAKDTKNASDASDASDASGGNTHDAALVDAKPPSGPYVVKHICSHSNLPFSKGGNLREVTVDLGAKTETILAYTYPDTSGPRAAGTPEWSPPPPTVTRLGATRLATVEADVDKVLRGGPFKQVNAVPEGISCSLQISAGGNPILSVQRSPYGDPITDAVTALIDAL